MFASSGYFNLPSKFKRTSTVDIKTSKTFKPVFTRVCLNPLFNSNNNNNPVSLPNPTLLSLLLISRDEKVLAAFMLSVKHSVICSLHFRLFSLAAPMKCLYCFHSLFMRW